MIFCQSDGCMRPPFPRVWGTENLFERKMIRELNDENDSLKSMFLLDLNCNDFKSDML